ncbi:MAG: ATP-binding cassette domain-containing protein [Bacteroidota bacterium]|nr:ATP-binding cassette domain-containing protein [Bacteroidota bacterium]
MIEVKNIIKSFGPNLVLDNVSASFFPGKVNLVIGRSGSGKTVAIKSMLGLHEIDSGSISFDKRNFSSMSQREKQNIRKEIGMVFQGGALFDSKTIEENLMVPLIMFSSMSTEQMKDRVNFCLKRVNLDNVNSLYPADLSGGMQKRVAIARAIILKPKYLFCDEPNSGLDPYTATVIDELLKEITYEYSITTVINTHDMNSVMQIGDYIIFIQKGKKLWEGSKDEIMNSTNKDLNKFIFSSEIFRRLKSFM